MTNLITNLRNQNTDLNSDFGAVKRKLEQLKNELKDKSLKLEGLEAEISQIKSLKRMVKI